MTPEIKSKIEKEGLKNFPVQPDLNMPDIITDRYEPQRLSFNTGATFGYSLAEGEIAASEEIIKLLQNSEDYLRAEIERLKAEIKSILKAVAHGSDLHDKIKEWT